MPLDFVGFDPQVARQARGRMAYEFGLSAEAIVGRFYEARGQRLIETRWRGAAGEIDLIFYDDNLGDGGGFIFVEVKASKTKARAAAHLGPKQMVRLCMSAEEYIGRQPKGLLTDMRIDVALVDGVGQVEILENALM